MKNERTKRIKCPHGERIRNARENAGYTQEKLSELIDVSPQYISDLERGNVGTSIPTLIRICEVLSVSSDYLLLLGSADDRRTVPDPLEITETLKILSPTERKIMYQTMHLLMEAFQVNS